MSIEIVAGAVQLQPWRLEDAPELLPALADPAIRRWSSSGHHDGDPMETARTWIGRRVVEDEALASWALRDATTGALVGQVTLKDVDRLHSRAELAYWVLPEARGRGVATTAVNAVSRYAFGAMGLERIELFHAVENTGSCAVAERCGFRLEGTHRRSHRYGDDQLHDEHSHARLADDPYPPPSTTTSAS